MMQRVFGFVEIIGRFWCRLMHDSVAWPIHGHYQCRTCLRRVPVQWERSYRPASTTSAG